MRVNLLRYRLAVSLAVLLVFAAPAACLALADGSVTLTATAITGNTTCYEFAWAAAADGSVPSFTTTEPITGYVTAAVITPGPVSPTDDYDGALADSDGLDIMGGQLADCDATTGDYRVPKVGAAIYGPRYVNSALTLTITGNSIGGAAGVFKIYVER
jgi:hypothetical protein